MCIYILSLVQLFVTHGLYSLSGSSVHGILQARILECYHSLLQGFFLTQELKLGLLHRRQILYSLSHEAK